MRKFKVKYKIYYNIYMYLFKYGTRRVPLMQVVPPPQPRDDNNSIEYNMCVEKCKNNEKERNERDRKRIEGFDAFERRWRDIEAAEEEYRVRRRSYRKKKSRKSPKSPKSRKSPKLYKTSKGSYYNKRYKDPHTGKIKSKRVYV